MLAIWAEMGAPASHQGPPYWSFANDARKTGAQVDAVLKLEKPTHPIGIHVV
jgi:hypothetical protein